MRRTVLAKRVLHVFRVEYIGVVDGDDVKVGREDLLLGHLGELAHGTCYATHAFAKVGSEALAQRWCDARWGTAREEEDVCGEAEHGFGELVDLSFAEVGLDVMDVTVGEGAPAS